MNAYLATEAATPPSSSARRSRPRRSPRAASLCSRSVRTSRSCASRAASSRPWGQRHDPCRDEPSRTSGDSRPARADQSGPLATVPCGPVELLIWDDADQDGRPTERERACVEQSGDTELRRMVTPATLVDVGCVWTTP